MMKGKAYTFKNAPRPLANYPHIREINGFLYLSGLSARNAEGKLDGSDIRSQTKAVIENAKALLEKVGATLFHVIDITAFLTDMNDYPGYNEIYNRYFSADSGPSRTTVAVKELPGKDLRIELKILAIHPHA